MVTAAANCAWHRLRGQLAERRLGGGWCPEPPCRVCAGDLPRGGIVCDAQKNYSGVLRKSDHGAAIAEDLLNSVRPGCRKRDGGFAVWNGGA
jgi:hypothetical protein